MRHDAPRGRIALPLSMAAGISRRRAVLGGAALIGGAGIGLSPAARAAPVIPADMCILTPRTMEGPYWFDPGLERADIIEGRAGVPLSLRVRVLDADSCTPIRSARVDIWQCDAAGMYSGYARQGFDGQTDARGETFLRGWQSADADGVARFQTIYPGTYPIRVTHIHLKAFLNEREALTAQIHFPEEITREIYRGEAVYADSIPNVRPNETDRIARQQGASMIAEMGMDSDMLTASVTIGVRG